MAAANTALCPRRLLLAPTPAPPAPRPSLRLPSLPRRPLPRLSAASRDATDSSKNDQEPGAGAAAPAAGEGAGEEDGEKSADPEAVAAELKEMMRARKEAEAGEGWWGGVAAEMAEIEWPEQGKVVGTTGVVLGVIAGSTAALLSVNALLAELSDRVFAGRGIQDFFSG